MEEKIAKPQYFRISLDIASRIAKGEISEGTRISGRSTMTAEYGVSPETIRRALRLLADMDVVDIRPQSCVIALSAKKAEEYVRTLGEAPDMQDLSQRLKKLVSEQAVLGKRILNTVTDIDRIENKRLISTPFQNYEQEVPGNSGIRGKNLSELHFWQSTGATIIAIRRAGEIILSPGPYATLEENDTIIFVGSSESVQAVAELVEK